MWQKVHREERPTFVRDVLDHELIPFSVDESRSTVQVDLEHERIPSTVAASSRAVARNLQEFSWGRPGNESQWSAVPH